MFLTRDTFDDLLREALPAIIKHGEPIISSRGSSQELCGVLLELRDPLTRVSRSEQRGKIFSGLGELLWYLSGSNKLEQIKYYISKYEKESIDKITLPGAYGPRMCGDGIHAQLENIVKLLAVKPTSRRAVVQLYDAKDLASTTSAALNKKKSAEVPCTCTLQFFVRGQKLNLMTTMRSNDAVLGLPHDVFSFTMIQEIVARRLDLQLGVYKHAVGSLHIYDEHKPLVDQYLEEGWQRKQSMPPMPRENISIEIERLQRAEQAIRLGQGSSALDEFHKGYWKDLGLLLAAFHASKGSSATAFQEIEEIKKQLSDSFFALPLTDRQNLIKQKPVKQI